MADLVAILTQDEFEHKIIVICVATIYFIAFLGMAIFGIIVTNSDPSDPTTKLDRKYRESVTAFSEGKTDQMVVFNEHKFEFYCEVCDSHVLRNTKHCQKCNRCTYEFDHHCYWVGNDIGLHNYASFMRMLISVYLMILTEIGFIIYTIYVAYDMKDANLTGNSMLKEDIFIVVNWICLVVCAILSMLSTYLLSYHIYLVCNNTTTYKHIRAKQNRLGAKSSIIHELDRPEDENKADNEVPPSDMNANSVVLDSQMSYESNMGIKGMREPRRLTCFELISCTSKKNPILKRIRKKTEITYQNGFNENELFEDDPGHQINSDGIIAENLRGEDQTLSLDMKNSDPKAQTP